MNTWIDCHLQPDCLILQHSWGWYISKSMGIRLLDRQFTGREETLTWTKIGFYSQFFSDAPRNVVLTSGNALIDKWNKFEIIIKGCHRVMAVRPVLCTPPRQVDTLPKGVVLPLRMSQCFVRRINLLELHQLMTVELIQCCLDACALCDKTAVLLD